MKLASLLAAVLITAPLFPAEQHPVKAGQSVYVVAISADSRRSDLASSALRVERQAREEFKKEKKFPVSNTLQAADFVFVVVVDEASRDDDELAITVPADAYLANRDSVDKLRDVATWQSSAQWRASKRAGYGALVGATFGAAALFNQPSVVKNLVKRFHKETL